MAIPDQVLREGLGQEGHLAARAARMAETEVLALRKIPAAAVVEQRVQEQEAMEELLARVAEVLRELRALRPVREAQGSL
jgi:hypothetical protein